MGGAAVTTPEGASVPDGSPGRLPNLVIVGVTRGGTTSLFNYLNSHPEASGADVKELRFFTPLRYGQKPGPLEQYAAHFRHAVDVKVAFEATPGYFYGGRAIAEAINSSCPDVRTVVSLRRPEDRCWSWFRFEQSRLQIPREMTFSQYLDRCEELRGLGVDSAFENRAFWGLGGGCYAEWLPDWTREFGDRFRVLFFDDLDSDSGAVMAALARWLGIDPSPFEVTSEFEVHNTPEQYRVKVLQRLAVTLNRRAEGVFRRHPGVKRRLRAGYYSLNRRESDKTLPRAERERLRQFYRPYNALLSQQLEPLGLRLPAGWDDGDASARQPAGT